MATVLAGVPVKPFAAAKQRLAPVLSLPARMAISQELTRRTCQALATAGAEPLILAADRDVARWAQNLGLEAAFDLGSSLTRAAAAVPARAGGRRPWLICHADLPFLDATVLAHAIRLLEGGRPVIAPSRDGGTPLLGARLPRFAFSYGPLSFHRHLTALAALQPVVLADRRLAVDLDQPSDLEAARRVRWIAELADTLGSP
jgi:2-phospho-L-lactate guanylyltransferase